MKATTEDHHFARISDRRIAALWTWWECSALPRSRRARRHVATDADVFVGVLERVARRSGTTARNRAGVRRARRAVDALGDLLAEEQT